MRKQHDRQPVIMSREVRTEYQFVMPDGRLYNVVNVQHPRNSERDYWAVRGGGFQRSTLCDPDGSTHKRVLAALQAVLDDERNTVNEAEAA